MTLTAELVAFDVFQPTLRSLGGISEKARSIYTQEEFKAAVRGILGQKPNGEYYPDNHLNLLARLRALEAEVKEVRAELRRNGKG